MPDLEDETPSSASDEDDDELEDEEATEDDSEDDEDEEDGDADESADDDADEDSDRNAEVGGADDDEETPDGEDSDADADVPGPTGRAVLELLAKDPEAQRLMRSGLEELARRKEATEAAAAEAAEFQELIEKKDYSTIGEKLVERRLREEARESVADDILVEQFRPVYDKLLAESPELKELTAEEKLTLDPDKYGSDAEYLLAISGVVHTKRFAKAVEAEVQKRLKTTAEAKGNQETAGKVAKRSLSASPGATGPVTAHTSSADKIRAGLRESFGVETADDDD